jgi:hypothetical protein
MSLVRINGRQSQPSAQRGATLVIALIMLVALALLAVWAFNSSTANLRIVGNTQARQEAVAAVQNAIELTISSSAFTKNPTAVAANPIAVDVNGDGVNDYSVTLSPAPYCYRYRVIPTSALDLSAPAFKDKKCLGPTQTDFGTDNDSATGGSVDSICASTDWTVRAVMTDAVSKANVAINQGMTVRVLTTDAINNCK